MNYDRGYNVYYNITDNTELPNVVNTGNFYKVAMPITTEEGPVNVLTYIEDLTTLNNIFGTYRSSYVDYSLKIAEDIVSNGGKLLVYRVSDSKNGYKAQSYFLSNTGDVSFNKYNFENTRATSSYQTGDNVFTEGGDYDVVTESTSVVLSRLNKNAETGSKIDDINVTTYKAANEYLFTIRSFYPSTFTPYNIQISPLSAVEVEDIKSETSLTTNEIKEYFIKVNVYDETASNLYEQYIGSITKVVDDDGQDLSLVSLINANSNYIFVNSYNGEPVNLRSYLDKFNSTDTTITRLFDNTTYTTKEAFFTSDIDTTMDFTTSAINTEEENIDTVFKEDPTETQTDPGTYDNAVAYKSNIEVGVVTFKRKLDYTSGIKSITFTAAAASTEVTMTVDATKVTFGPEFNYSKFNTTKDTYIPGYTSTYPILNSIKINGVVAKSDKDLVIKWTGDANANLSDLFSGFDSATMMTYDDVAFLDAAVTLNVSDYVFQEFTLIRDILDLTGDITIPVEDDVVLSTITDGLTVDMDKLSSDIYKVDVITPTLPATSIVGTDYEKYYAYEYGNPITVYDKYDMVKLLADSSILNQFKNKNLDYYMLLDMVVKKATYLKDGYIDLEGKYVWTDYQTNLNAVINTRKDSIGMNFTNNFDNDDVETVNNEYQTSGTLDQYSLITPTYADNYFIAYYGGWGTEILSDGEKIYKPLLGEYVGKIMSQVEDNPAFIPAGIDNYGVNVVNNTLLQNVDDTRWNLFDALRVNIPVNIKGFGKYMWFKNTSYRKNSDLKEINNIFALVYMIKSFYPVLIKYIHKPYTDTLTGTNYVANMINDLYVVIDNIIQAFAVRPVITLVSTADDLDQGIIKLKLSMKFSKTIKFIDVEFVFEKSGSYYTNIL